MKGFLQGFVFAWKGIRFAWQGRNFRIQSVSGIAVIILSIALQITTTDWVIIIIAIGLVLGFEMINSSIEYLVNFVSPEFHPLAGKIKDIAAGAVLVISIVSAILGVLIFLPYLLALFA